MKDTLVLGLSSLALVVACSDLGERDNPLDPGADNYVVVEESSSSSEEVSSSSKEKSSSSKDASSSSKDEKSSSSVKTESSSSAEEKSSSSKETSSSSADVESSSSEKTEESSSSKKEESSSSEKQPSSSESVPSSSSVVEPPKSSSSSSVPEWTCGDSTITRGDVQYRTVLIQDKCWMQENLRYEPNTGTTMCYGNDDANCVTYGRLYDYEAAQNACPTGWRLPTSVEYEALAEFSLEGAPLYDAGAHFKASSGWNGENGDDLLEFTALPGGKCDDEGVCKNIGNVGFWWTSSESVKNYSHYALFLTGDDYSYSATNKMMNDQYISVRCIKK